jgi:predicted transcriptional regulator
MIMIIIKSVGGSIIRDATIRVADEQDLEFVQGLQSLGVNRNVASLIVYFKNVEEGTSRNIERATGMRQPEVSIAMRTMRERNWITEREIKGDGKGRPMKIYRITVSIDDIIAHYEDMKRSESSRAMQSIQRLKEISVT